MNDDLGDRIKGYEEITQARLLPRSYTILRVDGRSFSNYTKNLKRPFDEELIEDLNNTWIYLCKNIQNAKLGYAQSDEFTLLLTDFEEVTTQQFFGGNIQKICSVVASMAAAKFNALRSYHNANPSTMKLAEFDCRVFTVPSRIEAYNTFYWRWKDAERNSISSVAYANFSSKQLHGKSNEQKQEMLWSEKGINWSKLEESLKNGRFFVKNEYPDSRLVGDVTIHFKRSIWEAIPGWKLSENPDKLKDLIPAYV